MTSSEDDAKGISKTDACFIELNAIGYRISGALDLLVEHGNKPPLTDIEALVHTDLHKKWLNYVITHKVQKLFNITEVELMSKSLFTILKVEGLFKKSEFNTRYFWQLARNMIQYNNLIRTIEISEHHLQSFLEWHQQNLPEMPLSERQFAMQIITQLCNHGLATYEYFKRFLLLTIDIAQLTSKTRTRLQKYPTLGPLVTSISKLPNVDPRISNELIDIQFRNALAHDSWYIDVQVMKYFDKHETEFVIPLQDLRAKVLYIYGLTTTVTGQYFKEYCPELIEIYDNEGGLEIMDRALPMYEFTPTDRKSQPEYKNS